MVHLLTGLVQVPYPSWLNPGDNTWQITAATFVGLMSLPGLGRSLRVDRPKEVGSERAGHDVRRLLLGPRCLGPVILQDRLRCHIDRGRGSRRHTDPVARCGLVEALLGELRRQTRSNYQQRWRTGPSGLCGQHGYSLPLPDHVPRLLPVRLHAPSRLCCSSGACWVGSSSAPGACWFRCGRLSCTPSTPSCCGAVAISHRRAHSTSPAASSSICRPACRALSQPRSSDPD